VKGGNKMKVIKYHTNEVSLTITKDEVFKIKSALEYEDAHISSYSNSELIKHFEDIFLNLTKSK
jgi:hypothetical protein